MPIRLTQIDGKLPNLALMKLSRFYRGKGEEIVFSKRVTRDLLEPKYAKVYGSAIFSHSAERVKEFITNFPGAFIGGTWNTADNTTVEQTLGIPENEDYDYSIYPNFDASIGFTQRGCRLKCGFCVVPKKEGSPRSVNTIASIWRGEGYPKHLHLLDNDFFGQPKKQWQARIKEIILGGFKVCLNQGINIRMIDDESAEAIASIQYSDDQFKTKRLYTAWDNIGDEERFLKGVATLKKFGIPHSHLLVYMLIGYDKRETWERLFHRFNTMVNLGIRPYPMVYGNRDRELPLGNYDERIAKKKLTIGDFQRYVIRRQYTLRPFHEYTTSGWSHQIPEQMEMFS